MLADLNQDEPRPTSRGTALIWHDVHVSGRIAALRDEALRLTPTNDELRARAQGHPAPEQWVESDANPFQPDD